MLQSSLVAVVGCGQAPMGAFVDPEERNIKTSTWKKTNGQTDWPSDDVFRLRVSLFSLRALSSLHLSTMMRPLGTHS